MDSETKREIILENNSHPFNKKTINDENYIKVNANNSSCIDNINLYLKFNNNILEDIYFDGEACAISTSATSILLKLLIGKDLNYINSFILNYEKMINGENYNKELINEANVFDEIYLQHNRKACALIPIIALNKALKEYQNK